jgi:hypothetical protein
MQLGWTALVLLMLGAAVAWFWQNSLAARERANAAAIEACQRLSLQFLDGTVAFAGLKIIRGTESLFSFRRTYVFDYTANSIDRRQGFVVLTGRRVESIGYARDDDAPRAAPAVVEHQTRVEQLPPTANVLSLDEWRARQRSATRASGESRQNANARD